MKRKTLDFLEAHLCNAPFTFEADAKWRQGNGVWLKWSQGVAMSIVDYIQENGLSRADIAERLGGFAAVCKPHFVRHDQLLF